MSFIVTDRCIQCGIPIQRKPKAKAPKYCTGCRETSQNEWKNNIKAKRKSVR